MSLSKARTFLSSGVGWVKYGSQTEHPRARGCVALGPQGTLRPVASPPEARLRASPAAIGGLCFTCILGWKIWQGTRELWVRVTWPLPRPFSCRCDSQVLAQGRDGTFVLGRWGRLGLGQEGIFLLFVVSWLLPLGGTASALA